MTKDRAKGLGRTQKMVLHLLASRAKTVRTLELDWWPRLPEGSIRSALESLARRGLVDVAGWDYVQNCRTYGLTEKGAEVERSLLPLDEDEDDA